MGNSNCPCATDINVEKRRFGQTAVAQPFDIQLSSTDNFEQSFEERFWPLSQAALQLLSQYPPNMPVEQRMAWEQVKLPADRELFANIEKTHAEKVKMFKDQINKIEFRAWRLPQGHKCYGMMHSFSGLQMGLGRRILSDGRIYEGFFFNGELIGQAKEVRPNGDAFLGMFQNQIRHGHGIEYLRDGSIVKSMAGQWVNGRKYGQFQQKEPNGLVTVKKFKNVL